MFVKSPLEFDEAAARSFSEKYIMSLESEYIGWYNVVRALKQEEREAAMKNRTFSEADLLELYPNPKVLDVGAGRASQVGTIAPEGHTVTLRACDVLAGAYSVLNSLFGLKPYLSVEFSPVERLTDKYEQNSFDIVRMQNALDHCYDPFIGIFEMMKVAKIGGTVRLIHAENEAERRLQYGMHQWNISSSGEDSMIIWQKDFRADVKDVLAGAAHVKTRRVLHGTTNFIHTDIVKLADIQTPPKIGMNILDESLIRFCLMNTSGRFSSAYSKTGHNNPFRRSMVKRLLAYAPMGLRKYVPLWLEVGVRKLVRRIGY